MQTRFSAERLLGLLIVIGLHGAVLYGLWQQRLIPAPLEAATLFVEFITPAPAPLAEQTLRPPAVPKPQPQPRPLPAAPAPPRPLLAEAPVQAPAQSIALASPAPAPEPSAAGPPSPLPAAAGQSAAGSGAAGPATGPSAGPVSMGSELSVACPQRSAPNYPALSRRAGEAGVVVLRVELDEQGHVADGRLSQSSGFVRLDEAALAAVRNWRCTPAMRGGQPVRATALQPFHFVQGN